VSRRADPARIYEARRAGAVARLASRDRLGDDRAEELVAAWELEAELRGIPRGDERFWSDGAAWMAERVSAR